MDLEQAKAIIKSEREAPIGRLSFAAGVLCSPENADKVSLLELIECLKRGNERKRLSLVNEYAALALYARTKRKRRKGHLPYEDFVTDTDDWLNYLKSHFSETEPFDSP